MFKVKLNEFVFKKKAIAYFAKSNGFCIDFLKDLQFIEKFAMRADGDLYAYTIPPDHLYDFAKALFETNPQYQYLDIPLEDKEIIKALMYSLIAISDPFIVIEETDQPTASDQASGTGG